MTGFDGTVTVLGAKGMLGYAVCEYFSRAGLRVIGLGRQEYDVASDPLQKLEALIQDTCCIVNCAGIIKPMIANTTVENVLRVNSIFPRNLGLFAGSRGLRTFHVTTDCVYSGRAGNYSETDYFDADDLYGMSKNGGDTPDNMVLRTSIVGEERGSGRSLLEWARSQAGKTVSGFSNHRWNGVTTVHLAEVILRVLNEGLYRKGIVHLHSPEVVTKSELLSIISEVYDLGLDIREANADTFCDRSLRSNDTLSRELCTKTIRRQLEEMRRFFSISAAQRSTASA